MSLRPTVPQLLTLIGTVLLLVLLGGRWWAVLQHNGATRVVLQQALNSAEPAPLNAAIEQFERSQAASLPAGELAQARAYYLNGQTAEAQALFAKAFAETQDPIALWYLGQLAFGEGSAEALAQQLAGAPDAQLYFVRTLLDQDDLAAAETLWRAIDDKAPLRNRIDSRLLMIDLRDAASDASRCDLLTALVDEALLWDPNGASPVQLTFFPNTTYEAADCLYRSDRIAEATTAYQTVFDLDPTLTPWLYVQLINIALAADDSAAAEQWVQAATTYFPDDPNVQQTLENLPLEIQQLFNPQP